MEEQKPDWKKAASKINKATEDYFGLPIDPLHDSFSFDYAQRSEETKSVTMEEQIKALIEKYETISEGNRKIAEGCKQHGNELCYKEFMGRHFENVEIISDLKQLLNKV